jgi:NitT/TauT family transport system substrate-binding protein
MRVSWHWLFALALALALAPGCRRRSEDGSRLRIGFMARLTQAPALTALESGRLARALPGVRVEPRPFEVGNAVVEALFAGELDMAFLGPNPAINGFVRSGGELVVLAGASSGGASLVVRKDSNIHSAADLAGRRLGTPQISSTQDIALRAYLRRHGLKSTLDGGDVTIVPTSSAELRLLMARGTLDGAWVSEPLVTQLEKTQGARVLVDERDEWPGQRHPTTVLAVRRAYYRAFPAVIERVLAAHLEEVAWIEAHRPEALALSVRAIERRLGSRLSQDVAEQAFARVSFTADPMPDALERLARDARAEGFLPEHANLRGLVVSSVDRDRRVARVLSP